MNTSHYSGEAQGSCVEIIQLKKQLKYGGLSPQEKEAKKTKIEDLKNEIKPFRIKKKNPGGLG